MRKRRFGISLPSQVAEELDELASTLEVNRSKLIEEMVSQGMVERGHLLREHRCTGVLMVVTTKGRESELYRVYNEFRGVIKSIAHFHSKGLCMDVLFIEEAESSEIASLEKEIRKVRVSVERYFPVCHLS